MSSQPGNLFGFGEPESESERRRRISRENRRKGKAAEEVVTQRYQLLGHEVVRTGRGHDFKATRRDLMGRVVDAVYIEVKYGESPLSELQWESRREHRGHYSVERLTLPAFYWRDL